MFRLTPALVLAAALTASAAGCSLDYAESDGDRARVELLRAESVFQFDPVGATELAPLTTRWGGKSSQLVESHELGRQFVIDDGSSESVARQYLDEAANDGWMEMEVRCDQLGYSVTGLKLVDGVRASFAISIDGRARGGETAPLAFLTGFIEIVDRSADRPPQPDPDGTVAPVLDCLASPE
jgi:hypothetical protein